MHLCRAWPGASTQQGPRPPWSITLSLKLLEGPAPGPGEDLDSLRQAGALGGRAPGLGWATLASPPRGWCSPGLRRSETPEPVGPHLGTCPPRHPCPPRNGQFHPPSLYEPGQVGSGFREAGRGWICWPVSCQSHPSWAGGGQAAAGRSRALGIPKPVPHPRLRLPRAAGRAGERLWSLAPRTARHGTVAV